MYVPCRQYVILPSEPLIHMMSLILALGPRYTDPSDAHHSSRGRIRSQRSALLLEMEMGHDFIAHCLFVRNGVLNGFITPTLLFSTNRACDGSCRLPYRSVRDWPVPGFPSSPCQDRSKTRRLDQGLRRGGSLYPQCLIDTSRSVTQLPPTPVSSPTLWVSS
jgi:hypothetical protein